MILLNKTTLMITGGVVYDPTAPHLHNSTDNWVFTLNVVDNIWRRYPNLPFYTWPCKLSGYQNVLVFDKLGNRYFNFTVHDF